MKSRVDLTRERDFKKSIIGLEGFIIRHLLVLQHILISLVFLSHFLHNPQLPGLFQDNTLEKLRINNRYLKTHYSMFTKDCINKDKPLISLVFLSHFLHNPQLPGLFQGNLSKGLPQQSQIEKNWR